MTAVYRTLFLSILLISFVLRLTAAYWWQQRQEDGVKFGFPDSEAYWQLAGGIAEGRPYELNPDRRVFRTPGYPVMLAGLFWLAGDEPPVMWARAMNAVLGVLAVLGVMVLAGMLFDRQSALLAGAVTAVYPSAVSMSTFVLTEAPFCPLMLLQLILWIRAWVARSAGAMAGWTLAAGLVAGIATLVRPSWLLFTPMAMLIGLAGTMILARFRSSRPVEVADPGNSFNRDLQGSAADGSKSGKHAPGPANGHPVAVKRTEAKREVVVAHVLCGQKSSPARCQAVNTTVARPVLHHALIGAGMILGLAAAMSPWWVRNWRVTGRFVPTTLQVGESLYDGLNPQATGASDMRFVDDFRQQLRGEDAKAIAVPGTKASFEERLDERMRDAATTWAAAHPASVLRLAATKFLRMWNVWPNEASLRHWALGLALMLAYTPVLVLSLCGAWRFARHGWPYVLCIMPAVYFTCLHVVFVGSIRYRQPAMLPLIALAAGATVQLVRRWRMAGRKEELAHT